MEKSFNLASEKAVPHNPPPSARLLPVAYSRTDTHCTLLPEQSQLWAVWKQIQTATKHNDGTCWRWVENGSRIKFAWQNTRNPMTHLILALMCFLFSRLISFWFRFLLTVNKYHQFKISYNFGIWHPQVQVSRSSELIFNSTKTTDKSSWFPVSCFCTWFITLYLLCQVQVNASPIYSAVDLEFRHLVHNARSVCRQRSSVAIVSNQWLPLFCMALPYFSADHSCTWMKTLSSNIWFDVLIWWASLLFRQVTCKFKKLQKCFINGNPLVEIFFAGPAQKQCASDVCTVYTKAVMPKEHVHGPLEIFHITLFSATNVQHVR